MKLTPLDIRHKEFTRAMRGYKDLEVDEYLDEIVDEFERLYNQNNDYRDRLEILGEKLEQYQNIEETLKKTLVSAQQQADELKQNSKKEADLILRDAELKARSIINDSYAERQKVHRTVQELKQKYDDLRYQIRSVIESYMNIIEQDAAAAGVEEIDAIIESAPETEDAPAAGQRVVVDPEAVEMMTADTGFDDEPEEQAFADAPEHFSGPARETFGSAEEGSASVAEPGSYADPDPDDDGEAELSYTEIEPENYGGAEQRPYAQAEPEPASEPEYRPYAEAEPAREVEIDAYSAVEERFTGEIEERPVNEVEEHGFGEAEQRLISEIGERTLGRIEPASGSDVAPEPFSEEAEDPFDDFERRAFGNNNRETASGDDEEAEVEEEPSPNKPPSLEVVEDKSIISDDPYADLETEPEEHNFNW